MVSKRMALKRLSAHPIADRTAQPQPTAISPKRTALRPALTPLAALAVCALVA
jgi:hypothetical protein